MWTTIAALLLAGTSAGFESCHLEASHSGYWHITPWGGAWDLSIPPNGSGRLVVHDPNRDRVRSVQLSASQLRKLSAALSAADFMNLEDPELYLSVADECTRSIRVRCQDEVHDVKFGDTPHDTKREDPDRVRRFSRALHVWIAVRSLFDDEKAADTRRDDQRFLKEHPLP